MFTLLSVIVTFAALMLIFVGSDLTSVNSGSPGPLFWLGATIIGIWVLASIIPSIALQVRRFHDQDRSGWMVLLGFIPYVGGLIVFIFMCLKGTTGPNRFGPDPLDPSSIDVFS